MLSAYDFLRFGIFELRKIIMANIDRLVSTQVDYNQTLYDFLRGKMVRTLPGANGDGNYVELLNWAVSHYRSEFCGFFRAFHINKSTVERYTGGRSNRGSSIYNTLQVQGIDLGLGSLSSVITHLIEIKQRVEDRREQMVDGMHGDTVSEICRSAGFVMLKHGGGLGYLHTGQVRDSVFDLCIFDRLSEIQKFAVLTIPGFSHSVVPNHDLRIGIERSSLFLNFTVEQQVDILKSPEVSDNIKSYLIRGTGVFNSFSEEAQVGILQSPEVSDNIKSYLIRDTGLFNSFSEEAQVGVLQSPGVPDGIKSYLIKDNPQSNHGGAVQISARYKGETEFELRAVRASNAYYVEDNLDYKRIKIEFLRRLHEIKGRLEAGRTKPYEHEGTVVTEGLHIAEKLIDPLIEKVSRIDGESSGPHKFKLLNILKRHVDSLWGNDQDKLLGMQVDEVNSRSFDVCTDGCVQNFKDLYTKLVYQSEPGLSSSIRSGKRNLLEDLVAEFRLSGEIDGVNIKRLLSDLDLESSSDINLAEALQAQSAYGGEPAADIDVSEILQSMGVSEGNDEIHIVKSLANLICRNYSLPEVRDDTSVRDASSWNSYRNNRSYFIKRKYEQLERLLSKFIKDKLADNLVTSLRYGMDLRVHIPDDGRVVVDYEAIDQYLGGDVDSVNRFKASLTLLAHKNESKEAFSEMINFMIKARLQEEGYIENAVVYHLGYNTDLDLDNGVMACGDVVLAKKDDDSDLYLGEYFSVHLPDEKILPVLNRFLAVYDTCHPGLEACKRASHYLKIIAKRAKYLDKGAIEKILKSNFFEALGHQQKLNFYKSIKHEVFFLLDDGDGNSNILKAKVLENLDDADKKALFQGSDLEQRMVIFNILSLICVDGGNEIKIEVFRSLPDYQDQINFIKELIKKASRYEKKDDPERLQVERLYNELLEFINIPDEGSKKKTIDAIRELVALGYSDLIGQDIAKMQQAVDAVRVLVAWGYSDFSHQDIAKMQQAIELDDPDIELSEIEFDTPSGSNVVTLPTTLWHQTLKSKKIGLHSWNFEQVFTGWTQDEARRKVEAEALKEQVQKDERVRCEKAEKAALLAGAAERRAGSQEQIGLEPQQVQEELDPLEEFEVYMAGKKEDFGRQAALAIRKPTLNPRTEEAKNAAAQAAAAAAQAAEEDEKRNKRQLDIILIARNLRLEAKRKLGDRNYSRRMHGVGERSYDDIIHIIDILEKLKILKAGESLSGVKLTDANKEKFHESIKESIQKLSRPSLKLNMANLLCFKTGSTQYGGAGAAVGAAAEIVTEGGGAGAAVGGGDAAGVSGEEDDSQLNDFVIQAVFYKRRFGRDPVSRTASRLVLEYSKDPKVAEALSLL